MGGGWKQWHSLASPAESFCSFPAFSVWSLSLDGCSEAVHSASSCLTGVIALSICVYLSLLLGGGEFRVLLHHLCKLDLPQPVEISVPFGIRMYIASLHVELHGFGLSIHQQNDG